MGPAIACATSMKQLLTPLEKTLPTDAGVIVLLRENDGKGEEVKAVDYKSDCDVLLACFNTATMTVATSRQKVCDDGQSRRRRKCQLLKNPNETEFYTIYL